MRVHYLIPILALLAALPAAADSAIRLDDLEPYELKAVGFELPRSSEVHITGVGHRREGWDGWGLRLFDGGDRDSDRMDAYGWLIDAETREPVWVMGYHETEHRSGQLREADTRIDLPAGRYELYLFSGADLASRFRHELREDREESWWKRMWSRPKAESRRFEEDLAECFVAVEVAGLPELRRYEVTGDLPGALIRLNRAGHSRLESVGFALDRPSALRVYGFTEHDRDEREAADYGFIVDVATRERVWDAGESRYRKGGGGQKNRRIDEDVELSAGKYILYYGTDDSHSLEGFNANPPYDPFNWGLTVLPGAGYEPGALTRFEPVEPVPAVAFDGLADRVFREQAFRVARDGQIRVHALGECLRDDHDCADYSSIVDARTGRTVWEMTWHNTYAGGGSAKNRVFDGLVDLARGDYVLHAVTDGSHDHGDWNAAAPFEPDAWGVRLWPGPGLGGRDLVLLDPDDLRDGGAILARVIRVGDHVREHERFTLEERTRVRIYALGEGQSERMYDYGYILGDGTRRTIWEMEWKNTRHAGGAGKNRVVEEELTLDPGSYEVVYVSDGSHSFEGWNAGRPHDSLNWGITVSRLD